MRIIELLTQEEKQEIKGGEWFYDQATDQWIWIETSDEEGEEPGTYPFFK